MTRDFANFTVPMIIAGPVASTPEAKTSESSAPVTKAAVAPAVPEKKVKAPAVGASAVKAGQVSINTATVEQLTGVKGLPTMVAEGIVARRPFRSLDELVKIKGMGEKLLAKLRGKLKL